jgi:hypothetical protein
MATTFLFIVFLDVGSVQCNQVSGRESSLVTVEAALVQSAGWLTQRPVVGEPATEPRSLERPVFQRVF